MDTQETALYIGLVVVTFLLTAAIISFAYLYNRRNKMYFDAKQRIEVFLLEEERKRISRDLHDELMPELMISSLQLTEMIRTGNYETDKINHVQSSLQQVIGGMRNIVSSLNTVKLVQDGLGEALHDMVSRFQHVYKMTIGYQYLVLYDPGEVLSMQVYRIVQELIQNAVKHSGASEIRILLQGSDSELTIEFTDNGNGFDPETRKNGIGLTSLRERAVLLGGTIHCESRAGKGTRYLINLPLKR